MAERSDEGVRAALEAALERVAYVPGDHPVVPVKHARFVEDVRAALSTPVPVIPMGTGEGLARAAFIAGRDSIYGVDPAYHEAAWEAAWEAYRARASAEPGSGAASALPPIAESSDRIVTMTISYDLDAPEIGNLHIKAPKGVRPFQVIRRGTAVLRAERDALRNCPAHKDEPYDLADGLDDAAVDLVKHLNARVAELTDALAAAEARADRAEEDAKAGLWSEWVSLASLARDEGRDDIAEWLEKQTGARTILKETPHDER